MMSFAAEYPISYLGWRTERPDSAECQQIIRADERGERQPRRQRRIHRRLTRGSRHLPRLNAGDCHARGAGGSGDPSPAIMHLGNVGRPGEPHQRVMSQPDHVLGGEMAAEHVVDRDAAHVLPGLLVVEECDGRPIADEPGEGCQALPCWGDEHTPDTLRFEDGEVAILALGLFVRVAQDDRVAALQRGVLDAPRGLGEEGVGDVGNDETDDLRTTGAELAGRRVGNEAQLLDGGLDASTGLG